MLHLAFFRAADADHRLLHLARRIFKHRQVLIDRRDNRRAARLSQLQRRIGVFRHKHLFDGEKVRLELRDNFTDAGVNQLQTGRQIVDLGADAAAAQVS